MNASFRQLGLILCKNFVLRKRHWVSFILEFLLPVVIFLILAILTEELQGIQPRYVKDPIIFERDDPFEAQYHCSSFDLLYSPENKFTQSIMKRLEADLLEIKSIPCIDEEKMVEKYINLRNQYVPRLFGIVFEETSTNFTLHNGFRYTVRPGDFHWSTENLFPQFPSSGPMEISDHYLRHCFIKLQLALDRAFIQHSVSDPKISNWEYKFYVQKFPYPPHQQIHALELFYKHALPGCMIYSFFLILVLLVKRVVEEKASGAKELMSMMGMRKWMQWIGWYAATSLIMLSDLVIIVILLKVGYKGVAIVRYSDWFLVLIFLFLYCLASVSTMFVIAACCSKENIAVLVAALLSVVSSAVPSLIPMKGISCFGKMLLCLIPNFGIYYGFEVIGLLEQGSSGLQWKNLWRKPGGRMSELSVGEIFIAFMVSGLIYAIIVWYVDKVLPGQYGVSKPWYFPLQPLFVKLHTLTSSRNDYFGGENECFTMDVVGGQVYDSNSKLAFEPLPPGKNPSIKIRGVRKVFGWFTWLNEGAVTVAVDNVSLDMLEGEITALLGHNGAGKTTLISILSGIYSASDGRVSMGGYDVKKKMDKIRGNLGLCPQHSLLFPELTVREHLLFFSMSKGLTYTAAKEESNDLMEKLNLDCKKDALAKTLSGGMKRKLSVGIALAGKSKILILDEPTSGMDPESRRHLWDMLLDMRGEHTILLTTHYMEEADILGDRIAIMVQGKVKCYGTSLFLKNIYGAGYNLTLLFNDKAANKDDAMLKTIDIVQQTVPGTSIRNRSATELSYTLPSTSASYFPKVFQTLDQEKRKLGISGVSLTVTTLEEVFLEVGKLSEAGDMTDGKPNGRSRRHGRSRVFESLPENATVKVCGIQLYIQQARALMIKKALFMKSVWIQLLLQMITGIALLLVAIHSIIQTNNLSTEPPLTFSIQDYKNSNAFVSGSGIHGVQAEGVYVTLLAGKGTAVNPVHWDGVLDAILNASMVDEDEYRENFVVSASFDENGVTSHYSTTLPHSCPTSVNLVTTTLLRLLTNSSDKSIITTIHPFPSVTLSHGVRYDIGEMIIWMHLWLLGLNMICAFFTMLPTLEGASGARHLQLMAMQSFPFLFWLVPFLLDVALFLVVICIALLIFPLTAGGSWIFGSEFYGSLLLLSLMFAACAIPFAYLVSYFKKTTGSAFSFFIVFSIIFGAIYAIIVLMMEIFLDNEKVHVGMILHAVGLVVPFFTAAIALAKLGGVAVHNMECSIIDPHLRNALCEAAPSSEMGPLLSCCEEQCKESGSCHELISYLGWGNFSASDYLIFGKPEGIGIELVALASLALFYLGLLYFIDLRIFPNALEKLIELLMRSFRRNVVETDENGDDDVIRENERVEFVARSIKSAEADTLLVHSLKKNYGLFRWLWKGNRAVRGVSFGVRSGECFGLLGANGAGKTSTFEMITGSIPSSSGSSYVLSTQCGSWKKNGKYQMNIGYCPQFNATLGCLTGRQMLKLFACLRGVPYEGIDQVVQTWLNNLDLNEPADRCTKAYSGGNHRRLCTAISLMGDLPLVCLDEPTAGVDPVARRQLWEALTLAQSKGTALVLTSHSMEECEALCTKLTIMVNGEFLCIGTIPYLKNKYGQGYTLLVKLNVQMDLSHMSSHNVQTLKEQIETAFTPCSLKDEHEGLLHYHIISPETKWMVMFSVMEELKGSFHPLIEDYSISDTTLEQVFLSFIRAQKKDK